MDNNTQRKTIDRLIINSPYEEPSLYWSYDRTSRTFSLKEGRRPAGYVVASESSRTFDDPGVFMQIPLVNQIRPRIKAWREAGYPGATGITRRLLTQWADQGCSTLIKEGILCRFLDMRMSDVSSEIVSCHDS